MESSLRHIIAQTADEIFKAAKKPTQKFPHDKIVWGTVVSMESGTPNTLTITLAGGNVSGVAYLASYPDPTEGDYVACWKYGRDVVCLGGLSGVTTSFKLEIPMTFAVLGTLSAQSLPIFFVPVSSAQSVKLIGIRCKIASGTSIDIDVEQNGSSVTGLTGLTVTPTSTSHILGTSLSLANGDEIGINMSSPSGTPVNLSGSLYLSFMSGS